MKLFKKLVSVLLICGMIATFTACGTTGKDNPTVDTPAENVSSIPETPAEAAPEQTPAVSPEPTTTPDSTPSVEPTATPAPTPSVEPAPEPAPSPETPAKPETPAEPETPAKTPSEAQNIGSKGGRYWSKTFTSGGVSYATYSFSKHITIQNFATLDDGRQASYHVVEPGSTCTVATAEFGGKVVISVDLYSLVDGVYQKSKRITQGEAYPDAAYEYVFPSEKAFYVIEAMAYDNAGKLKAGFMLPCYVEGEELSSNVTTEPSAEPEPAPTEERISLSYQNVHYGDLVLTGFLDSGKVTINRDGQEYTWTSLSVSEHSICTVEPTAFDGYFSLELTPYTLVDGVYQFTDENWGYTELLADGQAAVGWGSWPYDGDFAQYTVRYGHPALLNFGPNTGTTPIYGDTYSFTLKPNGTVYLLYVQVYSYAGDPLCWFVAPFLVETSGN